MTVRRGMAIAALAVPVAIAVGVALVVLTTRGERWTDHDHGELPRDSQFVETVFSPDGRHMAYARFADGAAHVILDGQPGAAFKQIQQLVFLKSGRLVYLALRNDKWIGSGDKWFSDPRLIDQSAQITQAAFQPGIDRGHLTRREDAAWGDDTTAATKSVNDTFHFTNCSLQASAFNRGKDRWQGVEQFLLEQHAKKDKLRLVVITGPFLSDKDPVYKNDAMAYSVQCPLHFWKLCVLIRQSDSQPSATAYILGQQEITDLPGFQESFDLTAAQVTVAELAQRTNLDFSPLLAYDRLAQGVPSGELEALRGRSRVRALRTWNDALV